MIGFGDLRMKKRDRVDAATWIRRSGIPRTVSRRVPIEEPSLGDREGVVFATVMSNWASKRLQGCANRDPSTEEAHRWNECVTAADRAQEVLCAAVIPEIEDVGSMLKFGRSVDQAELDSRLTGIVERHRQTDI